MKPRVTGLLNFVESRRSAFLIRSAGIRTHVAPVENSVPLVHRKTETIAGSFNINLRSSSRGARRKKVALGNRVGSVRLWMNATYPTTQIIHVRRRLLGVPRRMIGPLIVR